MKTNENKNADDRSTQTLAPVFAAAVNRTDQWRELHALSGAWATEHGTAEQVRGLGAVAYLKKPVDRDALFASISAALAHHETPSP